MVQSCFETSLNIMKNLIEYNNATFGALKLSAMYRENTKYMHKNGEYDERVIVTCMVSFIIIVLLVMCFYCCYF